MDIACLYMQSSSINTVLIYPKVGDEAYAVPHIPLSVLSVASATQQKGYSVKIIDQRVESDWKKAIKNSISDSLLCFGISSMTGPQINYAIEIAKYIKNQYPGIPIVWGGVHASLLPEQTLESGFVDIVVLREGEITFPELMDALRTQGDISAIKGIAYKNKQDKIVVNPHREFCNLNKYAFLNYDLLDLEAYQKQGQERVPRTASVSLYTSRGCQFKCTYCYNNSFHDSTWRGQSAEIVIQNLSKLYENGIRNFIICDEYFFQDLERARTVCKTIIEMGMLLRFYFVNCRLDQIKRMTDDDLELFVKAGIKDLFIGIESGSSEELKRIKKGIDLSYLDEACKRLLSKGIAIQFSFMLGMPEETIDDIKKTVKLMGDILKKFPECFVPSPGKFIPFPGTKSYSKAILKGWKYPKSLAEWGDIVNTVNCEKWLGEKIGQVAKKVGFFASAIDTKINPRANVLLEAMRKIYSIIARWRVTHGYLEFVPEYYIMKSPLAKMLKKKKIV